MHPPKETDHQNPVSGGLLRLSDCPAWLRVGVRGIWRLKVQPGEPAGQVPGKRDGWGLQPRPREQEMFGNTEDGTAERAVTCGGGRALGP